MKSKKFPVLFPMLLTLLGMVVTACADSVTHPNNPTGTELQPTAAEAMTAPTVIFGLPTETVTIPTISVIATSRGPDLAATDPATVRLDTGGLQLVEFFRFT